MAHTNGLQIALCNFTYQALYFHHAILKTWKWVLGQGCLSNGVLSECGSAFLSSLMIEIYCLMGIKTPNMTTYHPQTDGLVERFNRTLSVETGGKNWVDCFPYILSAYHASPQESGYCWVAVLVIQSASHLWSQRAEIGMEDYTSEITVRSLETGSEECWKSSEPP